VRGRNSRFPDFPIADGVGEIPGNVGIVTCVVVVGCPVFAPVEAGVVLVIVVLFCTFVTTDPSVFRVTVEVMLPVTFALACPLDPPDVVVDPPDSVVVGLPGQLLVGDDASTTQVFATLAFTRASKVLIVQ